MIKHSSISILILIGIISHFCIISFAQNTSPVIEKSREKVIHQGKIYFIHKVHQGNTLYSICRTYKVSEEDIKLSNPSAILNPLSIGQTLKIPEISGTVEAKGTNYSPEKNKDYILHKVQVGETAFFLHKKYNVPLTAIYKYNPGSESGLAKGQIIIIPKEHLLKPQIADTVEKQEKHVYYTVQHGDTLYRIAKDYGRTKASLTAVRIL